MNGKKKRLPIEGIAKAVKKLAGLARREPAVAPQKAPGTPKGFAQLLRKQKAERLRPWTELMTDLKAGGAKRQDFTEKDLELIRYWQGKVLKEELPAQDAANAVRARLSFLKKH